MKNSDYRYNISATSLSLIKGIGDVFTLLDSSKRNLTRFIAVIVI